MPKSPLPQAETHETFDIDFLLLPGFSFMSFANAVEPLRMANKVLGREYFRYRLLSINGADVTASNATRISVTLSIDVVTRPDLLIICSSDGVEKTNLPSIVRQAVRRLAHSGVKIAGICTGAFVLGRLGLLEGRNCTIHWEYSDFFRETFPTVDLTDCLYVDDGQILTCAGGTAAFDMILHLVDDLFGATVRMKVFEIAVHGDLRAASQNQRSAASAVSGMQCRPLAQCITLMQSHLEEPLDSERLSAMVGLSRRQIERLFCQNLKATPMAYYRQIRLDAARRLLMQSDISVSEAGYATGFISPSHFSRAYREQFGENPTNHRCSLI